MANTDRLDSLVDVSAIEAEVKGVLSALDNIKGSLKDLAMQAGKIEINVKGSEKFTTNAKATKDLTELLKQQQKAQENLARTEEKLAAIEDRMAKAKQNNANASKQQAKSESDLDKTEQQRIKTMAEQDKLQQQKLKTQAQAQKEAAREQKVVEQITNDYLILTKAYSDAALKAKNYIVTLGENHPVTQQAIKDAGDYYKIISNAEQKVGQFGRNVGNYSSAFNGLNLSVARVAQELPSLTISAQQFFLAISNNLPMVADEIGRAKEEIAKLKSEGKEAPTVFQRIGASLISFQVVLAVGITLLTAYGPKLIAWAKSLLDGSEAAKKAAADLKDFNDQQRDLLDLTEKYNNTTQVDYGDRFRELNNELAYAKARGDSEDKILAIEREILDVRRQIAGTSFFGSDVKGAGPAGLNKLAELSDALKKAKEEYYDFLKTGVAFGEQIKRGTSDFKEREDQLRTNFELQSRLYSDQKKIVEDFFNSNRDLQVKDIEIAKYRSENLAKFFSDELKYRSDLLKEFAKSEQVQATTRTDARQKAYELDKKVLAGQLRDELIKNKNNTAQLIEIQQKYGFERFKLAEDLARDLDGIRRSSIKREREIDAEINDIRKQDQSQDEKYQYDQELAKQEKIFSIRKNELEKGRDIELRALEDRKNQGLVNEQEYQSQKARIVTDYQKYLIQAEIDYTQEVIKLAKLRGLDVSDEEAKLAELKLKFAENSNKDLEAKNKEFLAKEKELLDQRRGLYRGLASEVQNLFSSLVTGTYEREKNAIQEQIDALEAKKQKEIEVVNATVSNEEQKAAQITTINARADAERNRLETEQRKIDQQKAKFEKLSSILAIQIDTIQKVAAIKAQAALLASNPVTAALAPFALAQIPIVIASGELAAAAIAAKPIPKYKFGRQGGKAELAITGDGGVPEVIESPDHSEAFMTPNRSTLTWLPEGYSVHRSLEDYGKTIFGKSFKSVPQLPAWVNDNSDIVHALSMHIGKLSSVILGKREMYFSWDNGELKRAIRNGNSWTKYIQDNV